MAVTLANLKSHTEHSLAGPTSTRLDLTDLINDAGSWLYSAHVWNFRNAAPVAITMQSAATFVELPLDFGEITGLSMTSGLAASIFQTDIQTIVDRRSSTVSNTMSHYICTVVHPTQGSQVNEVPPPRLEIYPAATDGDSVTVSYRKRWVPLTDDTHIASVPYYAEGLLRHVCREYALGWVMKDLDERLLRVEVGRLMQACKDTDGLEQSDYGYAGGGAIQTRYTGNRTFRGAASGNVGDPA